MKEELNLFYVLIQEAFHDKVQAEALEVARFQRKESLQMTEQEMEPVDIDSLREKEERQRLDVKNLKGEGRMVKVENGITEDQDEKKGGFWTSDSEVDSTPSPSENSFTSDTDVSSSSYFCSTGGSEESDKRKGHNQYSSTFELCLCQPCFARSFFASTKSKSYPPLS